MTAVLANNALFTDLTRIKQRLKIENAIAKAHVVIAGGVITGIVLDDAGMGYTTVPDVAIIGDGINAAVTAIKTGKLISGFTITNGGTLYTQATVIISGGGVGNIDDFLVSLVNGVSAFIESRLNVKDGWITYKGVFRKKTITAEIIQTTGGQYIETVYYPIFSIEKIQMTSDWQTYTDYVSPFIKIDNYRAYLPNDSIREVPGASKMDYTVGYDNNGIPEDILDVALEIIQRKFDESPVSEKNQLGQASISVNAGASQNISLKDLNPDWNQRINQYRKPLVSKTGNITL